DPNKKLNNPLARIFLGGAYVSCGELQQLMGAETFSAFQSLGLIGSGERGCVCPVQLYPIGKAFIVSDRIIDPNGKMEQRPDREIVFLALTKNSQIFLEMLPEAPCDTMLDLGAGSGAAALAFSHTARQIWASDISARSVFFAEFNRRLNGTENVRNVQGSVYDAVRGLTFDRIVTHPPYDPSLASHWTFSDGGDDGEAVLRKIIEGLPAHLRPGGQLFLLARGADRTDGPFEQRLRGWLGDHESEFDICAVARDVSLPQEYAFGAVMTTSKLLDDYQKHMDRFKELGVQKLVYCSFLIERHSGPGAKPITIRRDIGERCTVAELEEALRLERQIASFPVFDSKFKTSTSCELHTAHAIRDGDLTPISYSIRTTAPFSNDVPCPEWIARVLASCNGKYSGRQLHEFIRKTDPVPEGDFEAAVRRLVWIGALRVL
ncbi:MAG TPA: methyltransferase, partial [Bryobacteraceae bacterium]|nr:methyltransferase [Bryobacteraceae bacterium]